MSSVNSDSRGYRKHFEPNRHKGLRWNKRSTIRNQFYSYDAMCALRRNQIKKIRRPHLKHILTHRSDALPLRPRPHWCVFKRILMDAFSPIVHTTTLSVFIENAHIWKRCPEWRHWKWSVSKTKPNENASVGTAETENFVSADVIHLFVACADDYCSVFERCVLKLKRISVDGENAAKTIVWMDAFLVKTERFENALVWTGPELQDSWELRTYNIWKHLNLVIWPKLLQVSCSSVVERPTFVRKVI